MEIGRQFASFVMPAIFPEYGASRPVSAITACPGGFAAASQWADVYRVARERTAEALRATRYDRAIAASPN